MVIIDSVNIVVIRVIGWMSSSQMSVDHSDADEREMNAFALVEVLASSDSFFKKLKSSVERGNNT